MNGAAGTTSTIIPCLRYREAHAAIDWLCKAFGFEKHAVYEGKDGGIDHAQLTFGNGMVMLSSSRDDDFGRLIARLDETGGRETQCPCVIVADPRKHYERARAAGAEIVVDFAEQDYGGAGYGCRDLEGHYWWFGSYDPWKA